MQELTSLGSLRERVAKTVEILDKVTPFSGEQVSAAALSFFLKLKAADEYKPQDKFGGQVILIKAKDNFVEYDEDYGLSKVRLKLNLVHKNFNKTVLLKVCISKPLVEVLSGNHRSILTGSTAERIANILHQSVLSV